MGTSNPDEIVGQTLWGDPVYRVPRKRGRPPFEWTQENSFKVSMLLSAGWTNDRIAGTVLDPRTGRKISVPTLKRYFRSELAARDNARDQLSAKQLMVAAQEAFSGNVGAMRLLLQLMDRNDRMEIERSLSAKPKTDRPEKLGKKVVDQQKAFDADALLTAELENEARSDVRH